MNQRFNIEKITIAVREILVRNGVSYEQAHALCNNLLAADINGVHSHGLIVFSTYIEKIKNNGFNITGKPEIIKSTPSFAIVDANNTIGSFSASYCMDLCISQCKISGLYTVFSRNANTFGAAFCYVKQATDARKIGVCLSNSPAAMPAWNGKKKILGTNPFAIGIPTNKKSPIILDMATSVVAKSKINEARKAGKEIPPNWALDKDGNPTTDPVKAIEGMMLPMAEHKGYGIALMIDILSGLLSGAGYLDHVNRFYSKTNDCMNVGQLFVAIDPEMVYSEQFFTHVDSYIDELHSSGENVVYPGEKKRGKEIESINNGLFLTEDTIKNLKDIFESYGIKDVFV